MEARQIAAQLGQRVHRQWCPFRHTQGIQMFGRPAQHRLEGSNAQADQAALDAVHKTRALAHEALVLAIRTPGILFGQRRNATFVQCLGSPPSQPRNTGLSTGVLSRSVLARRCSRETATLVGWTLVGWMT